MSSVGFLPRSSAIAIAYMISSIDDCAGSTSAYSGSSPPVISLDQRNSLSRSSCGTPSRPAMACSGSSHETCSTKSPLTRGGGVLGDVLGALCELLLQPTDGARGEAAGDDLAQPGVVRGVHVEHDAALQFDVLARHFLGPGRDRAVLPAGEDVAATRHLLDVGVLGEAASSRCPRSPRSRPGTSTQWIGSDLRSWASSATGSPTRLTSGSRKSKSAGIIRGCH